MPRLVEADLAAAGHRDRSFHAPICLFDLAALHAFLLQHCNISVKVVDHQIQDGAQQLTSTVPLREFAIYWVNCGFCRGHREDEPASTHVNRGETKHIAKESAVSLGILAVKKEMRADNHAAEYISLPEALTN